MDRWEVCLGGTFSPIHKGHLMLFERAFTVGKVVRVGLTSDEFATRGRKRAVPPYVVRERDLRKVLDGISATYDVPYSIAMITDRVGFADGAEIEAIVVSRETERNLGPIDHARTLKGLPLLRRFVVDMVLDGEGKVLSSTRVQNGEVDAEGRTKVRGRGGED